MRLLFFFEKEVRIISESTEIEVIARVQGKDELEDLEESIEELGETAEDVDEKINSFGESTEDIGKKAGESSNNVETFSKKLKDILAGAAVVAGIKTATTTFLGFDDAIRKVEATTGATTNEMSLLSFQARQLGKGTSYDASDAAAAQYEFSKAGFEVNQILAATPGILNTAKAGQLGLAEATEITGGVLRMFKLDASEAGRVGDSLAFTANSTSTDMRGLAESLKYAGKDAFDFKLSLEDTLAVLGSLGNEMLKDSMAGTGLQATFAAFKDKNKIKYLMELGIDVSESDGSYKNFLDIIAEMKEKLGDKEQITQKMDINTIFGEQGSRVVGRLLDLNSEQFEKLRADIKSSTGTAEKMAGVMEGGLGGALRATGSGMSELMIGLISLAEPGLTGIIKGINAVIGTTGDFLNWLNSGSYAANTLYFALVTLGVGYGIYAASVAIANGQTKLATAYKLVESVATGTLSAAKNFLKISTWGATLATWGFQAASTAGTIATFLYCQAVALATKQITLATVVTNILSGAMGVLSGLLAFVSSPVLAVVAAVAGLGAGFYFLYQKSEGFRSAINPLIEGLKSLWEWVKKFDFVNNIIDGVSKVATKTKDLLTAGGIIDEQKQSQIDKFVDQSKIKAQLELEPPDKIGDFDINSILSKKNAKGKNSKGHDGYYLAGNKTNKESTNTNIVSSTYMANSKEKIEKTKTKESSEKALITALNELKKAIEKIKSGGGNTIQINIPPELEENKMIAKLVEELKIAMMSLA